MTADHKPWPWAGQNWPTVEQAAAALGTTPRGVIYRLTKGHLKSGWVGRSERIDPNTLRAELARVGRRKQGSVKRVAKPRRVKAAAASGVDLAVVARTLRGVVRALPPESEVERGIASQLIGAAIALEIVVGCASFERSAWSGSPALCAGRCRHRSPVSPDYPPGHLAPPWRLSD